MFKFHVLMLPVPVQQEEVAEIVAPSPLETLVLPRVSFDDEEYSFNREAFIAQASVK